MNGFIGESSCMKYQSTANTSTRRIAGALERQLATTRSAATRPVIASAGPSPGHRLIVQ